MTWPPTRKWPRLAALAYALFGLILFGLSTVKPVRDDGGENFTFTKIVDYSYPCASHGACILNIDIPYKTAKLLLDHTPLDAYLSEKFSEDGYEQKYPVLFFMFTKIYSPVAPYAWLFTIFYGCLFYYCSTWLLVRGIALLRKKG
jgi:hypothetical protein